MRIRGQATNDTPRPCGHPGTNHGCNCGRQRARGRDDRGATAHHTEVLPRPGPLPAVTGNRARPTGVWGRDRPGGTNRTHGHADRSSSRRAPSCDRQRHHLPPGSALRRDRDRARGPWAGARSGPIAWRSSSRAGAGRSGRRRACARPGRPPSLWDRVGLKRASGTSERGWPGLPATSVESQAPSRGVCAQRALQDGMVSASGWCRRPDRPSPGWRAGPSRRPAR